MLSRFRLTDLMSGKLSNRKLVIYYIQNVIVMHAVLKTWCCFKRLSLHGHISFSISEKNCGKMMPEPYMLPWSYLGVAIRRNEESLDLTAMTGVQDQPMLTPIYTLTLTNLLLKYFYRFSSYNIIG